MPAVFVFLHLSKRNLLVDRLAPVVERIDIYPIKSLDGMAVAASAFSPSGTLQFDRAYALVEESGRPVNGKSEPAVHRLAAYFDHDVRKVTLSVREQAGEGITFAIGQDRSRIEEYFSRYFGKKVILNGDADSAFPDDPLQSQVTVVSTASLEAVSGHFGFTIDECRKRFRANIEIGNVPAFWEEKLVLPQKHPVNFRIGSARFIGVKPCPRCVVPSRHPETGETWTGFQKKLSEFRQATLPEWSPLPSYGNYYQLSVSCRSDMPHNRSATVNVGDLLVIERPGAENKKPAEAG